MISALIDCNRITDWDSFHDEFTRVFGFIDDYPRTLEAWLEYMGSLDSSGYVKAAFRVTPGNIVALVLEHATELRQRDKSIYDAIIEHCSYINLCRIKDDKEPLFALSLEVIEPAVEVLGAQAGGPQETIDGDDPRLSFKGRYYENEPSVEAIQNQRTLFRAIQDYRGFILKALSDAHAEREAWRVLAGYALIVLLVAGVWYGSYAYSKATLKKITVEFVSSFDAYVLANADCDCTFDIGDQTTGAKYRITVTDDGTISAVQPLREVGDDAARVERIILSAQPYPLPDKRLVSVDNSFEVYRSIAIK